MDLPAAEMLPGQDHVSNWPNGRQGTCGITFVLIFKKLPNKNGLKFI